TNNAGLNWTLTGPGGPVVDQRLFTQSDSTDRDNPVLGLTAGSYTLTVRSTGGVTAAYQFRLLDLAAAPSLVPGTPVSGTLDPANETDLYRFSAAAGDRFFFDVPARSGAPNARWRLVNPAGSIIFDSSFNQDVDTLALAQAGTYTLLLEGR